MSKNRVVIQEAVLKANSGHMENIKEGLEYVEEEVDDLGF